MVESAQLDALPLAVLRRLTRPKKSPQEMCDFCNVPLEIRHRHLLELSNRQILCVCDPCALRFENVLGSRYQLIPRDPILLPDFKLSDEQWHSFALPINLAFFYRSSSNDKITAMYPSPAGSTESLLTFQSWDELETANPILRAMKPDTQALLINRIGTARDHFIAPIDSCYELTGLVHQNWRGLSGGEKVWEELAAFFKDLINRSAPVPTLNYA